MYWEIGEIAARGGDIRAHVAPRPGRPCGTPVARPSSEVARLTTASAGRQAAPPAPLRHPSRCVPHRAAPPIARAAPRDCLSAAPHSDHHHDASAPSAPCCRPGSQKRHAVWCLSLPRLLTLNHIVAEFLSTGRRTTSMVVTVEQPDGTVLPELVQWLPSAARDEPIGTIGAAAIASSGSRPRMNGHVITRGSCMWRSAGASTSYRRTGPANTQFPAPRDPLRCPKLLNHKSRVHYTGSRPTPMSSTNEPAITLCDICRQGIVEVPHVGWLHHRPTRHDHEARPLAWLWRLQQ